MGKKNLREKSINENFNSFLFYYHWLKLLALSMFKYKDLPNGCDSDFIEKSLYEKGRIIFANHQDYGLINLTLGESYQRNNYDKPIIFTGYAGSTEYECNPNNSVVMQNNILNIPTMPIVAYFADKISRIDRVYDTHLLQLKTPLIFRCDKDEELTLKKILNDIYSNVPIIVTKKKFNLNELSEPLKTEVTFNLDNIRNEKNSIMNEFLTFIGINNININKKERLVEAEANANNELIGLDLSMFLNKRQEAIDLINKKFNLNIKVEAEKNVINKVNKIIDEIKNKGGDEDDSSNNNN